MAVKGPSQVLNKDATAEQVIGLVDEIGRNGSNAVNVGQLSGETKMGADLLPILADAEMLGLVKTDNTNVSTTEFGMTVYEASNYRSKVMLLKDKLTGTEPCLTALSLTSARGTASADQIARQLQKDGIQWDNDNQTNQSIIQELLIDWAVEAELLKRNKKGQFESFVEGKKRLSGRRAMVAKVSTARKEYREAATQARKKYEAAQLEARNNYRKELSAARKALKNTLAAARKRE